MLNMSNQYNKYITNVVNKNLKATILSGDKFFLRFEQEKEIKDMVEAFQEMEQAQPFEYRHEEGSIYRTISININGVRLVVASTTDGVTPDYLVTLRNLVGEQNGIWEGTALLSLLVGQLDSIEGGSKNLEVEGMPLHPTTIFHELEQEMELSTIEPFEKIILKDNLNILVAENDVQKVSFLDFISLFEVLEKGRIDDNDYSHFGIFKDIELDTYKGKSQSVRLNENRRLFNQVKEAHEYGRGEEDLQNVFTPQGAKSLYKENWEDTSFSQVMKYHEDYKKSNINKKAIYRDFNVLEKLETWDKSQSETAAGKRTRHIIIFNPDRLTEINIEASFDLQGDIKLKSEHLLGNTKRIFSASSNKIKANIKDADIGQFLKARYKHEGATALGATLNILILPIKASILEHIKSKYKLESKSGSLLFDYDDEVMIGDGDLYNKKEIGINANDQKIKVDSNQLLELVPNVDDLPDDGYLKVLLLIDEVEIHLAFESAIDRSIPAKGFKLWHDIRESNTDAKWDILNERIILGHQEFYLDADYKMYWNLERQWLEQLPIMHAVKDGDNLISKDLIIGDDLREAYSRFVTLFSQKNTNSGVISIPSLTTVDDEFRNRANEFIETFSREVKLIAHENISGRRRTDLFKLGTIITDQSLLMTPFHPLIVAFKLEVYAKLGTKKMDKNILKRISPESLMPFVYFPEETIINKLLKSTYSHSTIEWLSFNPSEEISVSDASQYLAKVVYDKLSQFKRHFSYLFINQSTAAYKVNVIEIENDVEVLKGIVNWMYSEASTSGLNNLSALEISLYRNSRTESAFDQFSRLNDSRELNEKFDIKLHKTELFEVEDVFSAIQRNLRYYKNDTNSELSYAHISFYKMDASSQFAMQNVDSMQTGIAMDGLCAAVPSMHDQVSSVYKSGFGLKGYGRKDLNTLLDTTVLLNDLAANLSNNGNNTFNSNEVLLMTSNIIDKKILSDILNSSHWVTLVDPIIDLDFFETIEEAIVIHYSDQYSSSSRYDAVTITSKSIQYYRVIKDFLKTKSVESTESEVDSTVKAFNTFNGEWLLRIIGSKGHYDREKLSIISAIKYTLAYYDHDDILWVPISLEEILRVAGAVGLSQIDGVFSAKNLGLSGAHSDDLLLLGLEEIDGKQALHFFPVEVKIGINSSTVLDKATTQVLSTYKGLTDALNGDEFKERYFQNFFAELFISNAKRIDKSKLWPTKKYHLSDATIEQLLRGNFTIGKNLLPYIGKGAILSFKKEQPYRSVIFEGEVMQVNLTEEDGYQGVIKGIDELMGWIRNDNGDFRKDNLLVNTYKKNKETEITVSCINVEEDTHKHHVIGIPELSPSGKNDNVNLENDKSPELTVHNKTLLESIRVKIGQVQNSNREIYWEFGNPGLANRHLLISGGSGQGKTYFMQCLLLEQAKLGISSIVVDYTEGFLPNQLEPEFKEYLGTEKLKNQLVIVDKLPINPFRKSLKDIGGIKIKESNIDIAERIKSVFSTVYANLGIQQQNAIYKAVQDGLDMYGESMNFEKMRSILEDDGSSYAKTALSTIRPLIDRNVFDFESNFDWADIINADGEVFVIQLTSFNRDVQLIITEFILWDLWNYSVQSGSKECPIPVLMDEAQNLDFDKNSPSGRILTEGRKFGWSAWYATQFLKSQLDSDELSRLQNAAQKIYFKPPEQELVNIASSLSKDPTDRKVWENNLANLKKGQCIVHSPILNDSGELTPSTPVIVNISPLSDRIQ